MENKQFKRSKIPKEIKKGVDPFKIYVIWLLKEIKKQFKDINLPTDDIDFVIKNWK